MADFDKEMPALADYQNPVRDYLLPGLPLKILSYLQKENKPVYLKRRMIEKIKKDHADIPLPEYNNIMLGALYKTTAILQPNYKNRPYYFNFIQINGKNSVVVLEMTESKKYFEVVTFFRTKQKDFQRMLKKTRRDGGQSIITDRQSLKGQQANSALPPDLI